MLGKTLQDLMNDQVKHEFASSYLYLAMAAYCEALNLRGFARWMRAQAEEEEEHALKFFDFINDRSGRVVLQAIEAPPAEFSSPLEMFQQALGHERKVTGLINRIYEQAVQEKDFASQAFLDWFVTEQVEEEKQAEEIVARLQLVGDDKVGLLMLDRELGERKTED